VTTLDEVGEDLLCDGGDAWFGGDLLTAEGDRAVRSGLRCRADLDNGQAGTDLGFAGDGERGEPDRQSDGPRCPLPEPVEGRDRANVLAFSLEIEVGGSGSGGVG